jgi:hypothetical protein
VPSINPQQNLIMSLDKWKSCPRTSRHLTGHPGGKPLSADRQLNSIPTRTKKRKRTPSRWWNGQQPGQGLTEKAVDSDDVAKQDAYTKETIEF